MEIGHIVKVGHLLVGKEEMHRKEQDWIGTPPVAVDAAVEVDVLKELTEPLRRANGKEEAAAWESLRSFPEPRACTTLQEQPLVALCL